MSYGAANTMPDCLLYLLRQLSRHARKFLWPPAAGEQLDAFDDLPRLRTYDLQHARPAWTACLVMAAMWNEAEGTADTLHHVLLLQVGDHCSEDGQLQVITVTASQTATMASLA